MKKDDEMKRFLIFVFLVVSVFAWGQDLDFRGIPFGASESDVLKLMGYPDGRWEQEIFPGGPTIQIAYADIELAGQFVTVYFDFFEDRMVQGQYRIKFPFPTDIPKIARTYNNFFEKLSQVYGEAGRVSEWFPSEDDYRTDLRGKEPFWAYWAVGANEVELSLFDNNRWEIAIIYSSAEILEALDRNKEAKEKSVEGF